MKSKSPGGNRRELKSVRRFLWTERSVGKRILIVAAVITLVVWLQGIAIAGWYKHKHRNEPLTFGVTFISDQAKHFGDDPQTVFKALRDDMGFKRFRLVTYWNEIEPQPGVYDFSDVDWQLKMVEEVNGTASISIGMRQPRWPECHIPTWAENLPANERNQDVDKFLQATIEHLRDLKTVSSYQLENEYFLGFFGDCPKPERQQLKTEYNLVKKLDPTRPIMLSLANNYFGVPTGQPRPDKFAVSVYNRIWDSLFTHRYAKYPFTPTYFAYRAGLTELFTGRESMLHELQVEPWAPAGLDITQISIAEQNKSMDSKRAHSQIQYAIDTGFRDIDLWGGEWWYWRKDTLHDPSVWNAVKGALDEARAKYQAT